MKTRKYLFLSFIFISSVLRVKATSDSTEMKFGLTVYGSTSFLRYLENDGGGLGSPTVWNVYEDHSFHPGFFVGGSAKLPTSKHDRFFFSSEIALGYHSYYIKYDKSVYGGYPYHYSADYRSMEVVANISLFFGVRSFKNQLEVKGGFVVETPLFYHNNGSYQIERLGGFNQTYLLTTQNDNEIKSYYSPAFGLLSSLGYFPNYLKNKWGLEAKMGTYIRQKLSSPNAKESFLQIGIVLRF